MEDDGGAWMNEGAKMAEFLTWFTSEPEAEAPLKNIVMISSSSTGGPYKNTLRMVSKQFKADAEEGTRSIKWKGPGEDEEEEEEEEEVDTKPRNLMGILASPVRNRDGCFKDRLPNLKSIDCNDLDTLMDLNGCPSGLEVLNCGSSKLIQSLAPLAACTNLRKLDLYDSRVSSLKPLMGYVKLERLDIGCTPVSDLRPLSACINLKSLHMCYTPVSDLSPLSGLHQLRAIKIDKAAVTDLSPLSSLSNLEILTCSNTKISDLTPLSKCSELKALDISATEVKSLTPLLQCKKFKYLNHSKKLKDQTKEQTEGYIRLFKELGINCTEKGSLDWCHFYLHIDLRLVLCLVD